MLTKKQHELLLFIRDRLESGGVPPSFDEMKDAIGLKSKSGVHRLITGLEERGFIRRLPHRARALEVLRLPESTVPAYTSSERPFAPSVIEGRFGEALSGLSPPATSSDGTVDLPLYGRIAAGTPIEALRDPERRFAIPAAMIGRGEHYALEIEGDSMIDAGIFNGDVAIIERGDVADNGSIVVALVDDEEATLKRLRRKGNSVALEAANEAVETRIFPPDRVRIQGKLVGLIRQY
jgi:repressor LexA